MQTELAQIISLTSYGNEFLKTGNLPENTSHTIRFFSSVIWLTLEILKRNGLQ